MVSNNMSTPDGNAANRFIGTFLLY
jgi:hypothetical protein